MTRADDTKPLRRLVVQAPSPAMAALGARGDEYVLEVYARRIVIRPKGCRRGGPAEVECTPGQLYLRCMIARDQERRRAKRKGRRR